MEHAEALPHPEQHRNRVLLIVGDPKDKRALSSWLFPDFDVVAPDFFENAFKEAFDIGVVDTVALRWLAKKIREARAKEAPVFLPFVLVASEEEASDVDRYPDHLVDEIVKVPADPSFLRERISALLQQRADALALKNRIDTMVRVLKEAHQDLETRVANRTRELSLAQQKLKMELDRVSLLLTTSTALTASLELDRILEALADVLVKASRRSRVAISLLDREENALAVKATRGQTFEVGEQIPLDGLPIPVRQSISENRAKVVNFQSLEEPLGEQGRFDAFGLALSLPLSVGNRVIGHIAMDEPGDYRPYDTQAVRLLEGIASQAAVVVENALLHERAVARARTLEAIAEIGRLMSGTLRVDEALDQIMAYSAILMDAPASIILLLGEECEVKVSAGEHVEPSTRDTACLLAKDPARIPKEAKVFRLNELPEPFAEAAASQNFEQIIVVPLRVVDTLRALILLFDTKLRALTSEDAAALRLFAYQAMTAISIAEAYEEEHAIADTLQKAILTMPSMIPGMNFGWLYRSATEAAQVGGDFFDLFALEEEKVGIVIGDVSGKGLEAATLTSLVKNTIKAYAYDKISPGSAIKKTNDVLVKSVRGSIFITAFFGVLDMGTGTLTYCNAGHPKPFVKAADKKIGVLPVSNIVIGAFPGMRYREGTAELRPGDVLILYTDGVVEARNDGEFFDEARLAEAVRAERSATAIPQSIFSAVVEFSNRRLADDIAILSISPTEDGAE